MEQTPATTLMLLHRQALYAAGTDMMHLSEMELIDNGELR